MQPWNRIFMSKFEVLLICLKIRYPPRNLRNYVYFENIQKFWWKCVCTKLTQQKTMIFQKKLTAFIPSVVRYIMQIHRSYQNYPPPVTKVTFLDLETLETLFEKNFLNKKCLFSVGQHFFVAATKNNKCEKNDNCCFWS